MDERGLQFCHALMGIYEERWTEAKGHQERHPLRLKQDALGSVIDAIEAGQMLDQLIRDWESSDDPGRCLLREELKPLWRAFKVGAG